MWSKEQNKWIFLPRRASKNQYNDVEDEEHGTNMMITANEQFENINVIKIGKLDEPTHGFSTFKFIPDSKETVIVSLKSEEYKGKIASYIMVFKSKDGTIILPETFSTTVCYKVSFIGVIYI